MFTAYCGENLMLNDILSELTIPKTFTFLCLMHTTQKHAARQSLLESLILFFVSLCVAFDFCLCRVLLAVFL